MLNCRNGVHCQIGEHVETGYMYSFQYKVFGCLVAEEILSKVKGMNGRGIMQTFHICARVLPKVEIKRYC